MSFRDSSRTSIGFMNINSSKSKGEHDRRRLNFGSLPSNNFGDIVRTSTPSVPNRHGWRGVVHFPSEHLKMITRQIVFPLQLSLAVRDGCNARLFFDQIVPDNPLCSSPTPKGSSRLNGQPSYNFSSVTLSGIFRCMSFENRSLPLLLRELTTPAGVNRKDGDKMRRLH